MKKIILQSALLSFFLCGLGINHVKAQEPIGPIGGPGPVVSAPGSPANLGGNLQGVIEQGVSGMPVQGIGNNTPPGTGPAFTQPAPGQGLGPGPYPAPGSQVYNPGPPVGNQPPLAGPGAPGPLAPLVVGPALSSPDWQNNGTMTVIACGTDAQGVWRTIPLRVSYNYNGAQYNVTVDSAWNPWDDTWNYGVDVPAFNTYYFLNGNYYNFYVNLSTGTWYFNLGSS